MKTKQKCKLIKFNDGHTYFNGNFSVSKILGIIEKDSEGFLTVKTSKKTHIINKKDIIGIFDTNIDFREEIKKLKN